MAVENVQGHAAEYRVAESRHLLDDVTGSRFAAGLVPGTPFVHNQLDVMLLVNFAHHLPVAGYERLHAVAFAEKFVPLHRLEVDGIAFTLHPVLGPATEIPGVVMERQAIDSPQFAGSFPDNLFKKTASPAPIVHVGAGCDKRQVHSVTWNPGGEAAKFCRVLLGSKISSTAPGLVSDAPESNAEGIAIAGLGSCIRQCGCSCRRIAILHPPVKRFSRETAHISRQVGLTANEVAEMDKLVGAEFIGIVFVTGC